MSKNHEIAFETAYNRALLGIRLRYEHVGLPYLDAQGGRRCDVNWLPRTDREIFELVWGPEPAARICELLP
jgi:hypothetical protein